MSPDPTPAEETPPTPDEKLSAFDLLYTPLALSAALLAVALPLVLLYKLLTNLAAFYHAEVEAAALLAASPTLGLMGIPWPVVVCVTALVLLLLFILLDIRYQFWTWLNREIARVGARCATLPWGWAWVQCRLRWANLHAARAMLVALLTVCAVIVVINLAVLA